MTDVKKKSGTRKITKNELETHLSEQISFLIGSCKYYDPDWHTEDSIRYNESEFKRIATTIRVLVHDTLKSESLLTLLSLKKIGFVNTSPLLSPGATDDFGLVVLGIKYGYRPNFWWSKRPDVNVDEKPFNDWWNEAQIRHSGGSTLSRKDLVLWAANKDGGAHVDQNLPSIYDEFKSGEGLNLIRYKKGADGSEEKQNDSIVHQSIRQIAHELLLTLQNERPTIFSSLGVEVIAWPSASEVPNPFRKTMDSPETGRRAHLIHALAEVVRFDELRTLLESRYAEWAKLEEHELCQFEKHLNVRIGEMKKANDWPPSDGSSSAFIGQLWLTTKKWIADRFGRTGGAK
ncbi:MAG: hypothetical protein HKM95_00840 [Inquilinus sp.]|nr:hypothetical protein [Inquilinus sp.]